MKRKVLIDGMDSENSVKHIRTSLEEYQGVRVIEINLAEKYAIVESEIADYIVKDAIEEMGCDVTAINSME
jgi:copper chaperone CopZ